jgi:hypothetical protein
VGLEAFERAAVYLDYAGALDGSLVCAALPAELLSGEASHPSSAGIVMTGIVMKARISLCLPMISHDSNPLRHAITPRRGSGEVRHAATWGPCGAAKAPTRGSPAELRRSERPLARERQS